jgi:hypothetical protein
LNSDEGGFRKTATLEQNNALYSSIVAEEPSIVTSEQCSVKLENYVQYRVQYWEVEQGI